MLQEKIVRFQLNLFKSLVDNCSLETTREGQDKLGKLMTFVYKKGLSFHDCDIGAFSATMITPEDVLDEGVILYLHGGGYTCGDIEYAKGFGSTLAAKCGISVFCPAYRLAPEAPFPAAIEDALASYKHLITLGFSPSKIMLCGESAGGGLIYALCLKLHELDYEMPAGLIAISPWSDLTLSGGTYETNREVDPSLTRGRLKYYADCYVHGNTEGTSNLENDMALKRNPLVSPLFGDLSTMPPSLLFVGGDEILLDDTRLLYDRLKTAGRECSLTVKSGMWHGYVLYCLKENEDDFDRISAFLKKTMSAQRKLRWMRLDNAAKIYPAIKTKQWNNFFRLSTTLNEPVDRATLQTALDVTVRRFPSIAVRLKNGAFWYYLEEIPHAPAVSEEEPCPLARTPFDDIRKCAFRVICYENRIATEFFHAITDGNGGLIFLKTLVAEYLCEKHGITIPCENGVFDRLETPKEEELEDSFMKNSGKVNASRSERDAFRIGGTPETDGFCTNTAFLLDAVAIDAEAHKHGVSVSAFLTALFIKTVIAIQEETVPNQKRRRDVRVLLPVNLRRLFGSVTLRNFVLYIILGVDVRLGNYSLDELCGIVFHQMKLELTEKEMRKRIAVNVNAEKVTLLKMAPLFLKNIVMKSVYNLVGERKSCFSLSNLGIVQLPEEMRPYVKRFDFILGVQAHAPYNVGMLSYDGTMVINFIRNIKEPLLERRFYEELRAMGIAVKAESNGRDE